MIRNLAAGGWIFSAMVSAAVAQEPDFAAALDSPGVEWTAPELAGSRASVVEAADAQGGSLVVIPAGRVIQVPVEHERFVKVRFRKSNARVRVDDTDAVSRPFTATPADAGTQWMTYTYVMPKPGMLKIGNYGGEVEVDTVTIIDPAETLAAELGLPEGLLTLGGEASWVIAPLPESDEYGAKVTLTSTEQSGWMELPVSGPAEVRVDYRSLGSFPTLRVSSGGRVRWDSAEDDFYGNHVVLELPSGQHVVRLDAGFSRYAAGSNRKAEIVIGGISVTPLEHSKILSSMDDDGEPWASSGNWMANHGPVRDGVDSLSAEGTGYSSKHVLRRTVTGPGTVSFWTFMGPVPTGSISMSWYLPFQTREDRSSSGVEHGWKRTSRWVPPGDHAIRWEVSGNAEQFSHMALDALEFAPSADLALGAASGLPLAEWSTDTASPWRGILRDGDERVVISPFLPAGAVSRLSATVNGPGVVSFRWAQRGYQNPRGEFLVNGRKWWDFWGTTNTEQVQVIIPGDGPVELVWGGEGRSTDGVSWFELSQVTWTALPEVPLAEALDTEGVGWTTSTGKAFKGRPNPWAMNGSAAQVGLLPGEEAWLEGTVEGSGLFDFWLRDVPGTRSGQSLQLQWDLYVDGVKTAKPWSSTSWPAKWVLGDGPHHLRLHFRNTNTTGDELFVAVDQVSWEPVEADVLPEGWGSDAVALPTYFPSGGREGAAAFLIPASGGDGERWIERTFTGPGTVEWDSKAEYSSSSFVTDLQVFIGGSSPVPVSRTHGWQKNRLYLPAGEHTVRWSANGVRDEHSQPSYAFDSNWQISGVTFLPGLPDLMKGIDQDGLVWLAVGDAEGHLQQAADANDADAWVPDVETILYVCNPGAQGLRLQARVDAVREPSSPAEWRHYTCWLPPGQAVEWIYGTGFYADWYGEPWRMDGVTVEHVEMITMAEGLDVPDGEISASGWFGIRSSAEAWDGVDSAWGRVEAFKGPAVASLSLSGASRVKFRWMRGASAVLGLKLDGAWLPVPPPEETWREVEFETEGPATVEWVLNLATGYETGASGEGWVDAVEISSISTESLAETLAAGTGLEFHQTQGAEGARRWRSVSYYSGGRWLSAARAVSGGSSLEATVAGPVLLSFRAWCGQQEVPAPSSGTASTHTPRYVEIISPGLTAMERFLTAKLDGNVVRTIPRDSGGGWTEHLIHVPAGEHLVSWQLEQRTGLSYGNGVPELQAMLGSISLILPRDHYDAWAAQALGEDDPTAPGEDADEDGVPNFYEYAYGTDPRNPASVPPKVSGGLSEIRLRLDWSSSRDFELRVPRLPSHVRGFLEESDDLLHWTPSAMKLRSEPLPSGFFGMVIGADDSDDGIYQVMRFRTRSAVVTEAPASAGRFYRVALPLPE